MSTCHRNPRAAEAARPFLESVFATPGTEIVMSDLIERSIKAGVGASGSTIGAVAATLVAEGFLVRVQRGIYKRPDSKGVALDIPPGPAVPEAPDLTIPQLANFDQRLRAIEFAIQNQNGAVSLLSVRVVALLDTLK